MDQMVVLVADTDPHTCLLISNLLGPAGYRVVTAPAKLTGLQTLGLKRPDLLLLGAPTVPDAVDDALLAFRDRYPDTPTVILSSSNDHAADDHHFASGRVITKPINPDVLLAIVHELVPIG